MSLKECMAEGINLTEADLNGLDLGGNFLEDISLGQPLIKQEEVK